VGRNTIRGREDGVVLLVPFQLVHYALSVEVPYTSEPTCLLVGLGEVQKSEPDDVEKHVPVVGTTDDVVEKESGAPVQLAVDVAVVIVLECFVVGPRWLLTLDEAFPVDLLAFIHPVEEFS
jgi:hypothetical protein